MSRWAEGLALGLAGLIGVGVATVPAAPARTAASAFELTFEGKLTGAPSEITSEGTFRSRAPVCTTGTFVDERPDRPPRAVRNAPSLHRVVNLPRYWMDGRAPPGRAAPVPTRLDRASNPAPARLHRALRAFVDKRTERSQR